MCTQQLNNLLTQKFTLQKTGRCTNMQFFYYLTITFHYKESKTKLEIQKKLKRKISFFKKRETIFRLFLRLIKRE